MVTPAEIEERKKTLHKVRILPKSLSTKAQYRTLSTVNLLKLHHSHNSSQAERELIDRILWRRRYGY